MLTAARECEKLLTSDSTRGEHALALRVFMYVCVNVSVYICVQVCMDVCVFKLFVFLSVLSASNIKLLQTAVPCSMSYVKLNITLKTCLYVNDECYLICYVYMSVYGHRQQVILTSFS